MIRVLLWCGMSVFAVALIQPLYRELPLNDFIEYWFAGRLFARQQTVIRARNARDSARRWLGIGSAAEDVQSSVGSAVNRSICSNALSISANLLADSGHHSALGSANLLWRYYGGLRDRRLIAWVCADLFFPNPVASRMGQFLRSYFVDLLLFSFTCVPERP